MAHPDADDTEDSKFQDINLGKSRWEKAGLALKMIEDYVSRGEKYVAQKYNIIVQRHPVSIAIVRFLAQSFIPPMALNLQTYIGNSSYTKDDVDSITRNFLDIADNLKEIQELGKEHYDSIYRELEKGGLLFGPVTPNQRQLFEVLPRILTIYSIRELAQVKNAINQLRSEILEELRQIRKGQDALHGKVDLLVQRSFSGSNLEFDWIRFFMVLRNEAKTIKSFRLSGADNRTKALLAGVTLIGVSLSLLYFYYKDLIHFILVLGAELTGVALFMYSFASQKSPISRTPILSLFAFTFAVIAIFANHGLIWWHSLLYSEFAIYLLPLTLVPILGLLLEYAILQYLDTRSSRY